MKRALIVLAIFFAIGVAIDAPFFGNAFVFDDRAKIVDNPDIRDLARLPSTLIYPYDEAFGRARNDPSRPLVYLTYALDYAVFGLDPRPYHATDLVFHVLAAFFGWLFFDALLRKERSGRLLGFCASLLFLCHPLAIETALYAYARSDVLSAMLVLGALAAHVSVDGRGGRVLVALVFALALASKQSAIVLPLLLLAVDRIRGERPTIARHAPVLGIALCYLVVRLCYFGSTPDLESEPAALIPPRLYADAQPYAIARYVQLLLLPVGLSMDHALYPGALTLGAHVLGWGFVAAALLIYWRLGQSVDHSRSAMLARFAMLAAAIVLLPTSSILPTSDLMVERRAYLAAPFVLFLGLLSFEVLFERLPAKVRALRPALLAGALIGFAFAAHERGRAGRTERAFWNDVLATYPESERALHRLAEIAETDADEEGAIALYDRLFHAFPRHFAGYNSLGALYFRKGDYARAEKFFRFALSIDPRYGPARANLDRVVELTGARTATAAIIADQKSPLAGDAHPHDSAYKQAVTENAEVIIQLYRGQIEKDPSGLKFRRKLIEFLIFVDRREDALVELRALETLAPRDPAVSEMIRTLEDERSKR